MYSYTSNVTPVTTWGNYQSPSRTYAVAPTASYVPTTSYVAAPTTSYVAAPTYTAPLRTSYVASPVRTSTVAYQTSPVRTSTVAYTAPVVQQVQQVQQVQTAAPQTVTSTSYVPVQKTSYQARQNTVMEPVTVNETQQVKKIVWQPVETVENVTVPKTTYQARTSTTYEPVTSTEYQQVTNTTTYQPQTTYTPVTTLQANTSYTPVTTSTVGGTVAQLPAGANVVQNTGNTWTNNTAATFVQPQTTNVGYAPQGLTTSQSWI